MSVFRLPENICTSITSIIRKFWRGNRPDDKSLCWKDWDVLCRPKDFGGLGFRNIKLFNTALLAKQGWRLIQNPETLASRILKAKYFPNVNFLESNVGRNPSYTWRSIVSAKDLLIEGGIWRVGNGFDINMWSQKWLMGRSHGGMIGPPNKDQLQLKVGDFIRPEGGEWDERMLRDHFLDVDVQEITRMRLPNFPMRDFFSWKGEKIGEYSVKSGYRLLQQNIDDKVGSKKGWRNLWKCMAPPKVRHFGWRVLHGILPTREALARRGINISTVCPICMQHQEDLDHSLISCEWARKVWQHVGVDLHQYNLDADGETQYARKLLMGLATGSFNGDMELCLFSMWSIWNHRNEVIFKEKRSSFEEVGWKILNHLQMYKQVCVRPGQQNQQEEAKWQAPSNGIMKINCDGAYKGEHSAGFGAIMKDCDGILWAAIAGSADRCNTAEEVQSIAIREGLQLAKELKLPMVIVESDAQSVIKEINKKEPSLSSFGDIIQEIKHVAKDFTSCSFQFVSRSCNKVADLFASLGCSLDNTRKWVHELPIKVSDVIFD